MRTLLLILSFITLQAHSQALFHAHNRVTGGGAPSTDTAYDKPLDLYPATLAYSTRKVRSAYTGPALRLRNGSTNAEMDISFTPNGNFDAASATAFLAGATGYVVKWYDQSGSGVDAVAPSTAAQPVLLIAGFNGKTALDLSGGGRYFSFTTSLLAAKYPDWFMGLADYGGYMYGAAYLSWGNYWSGTYIMWITGAGNGNFYLQDNTDAPTGAGQIPQVGGRSYLMNMYVQGTSDKRYSLNGNEVSYSETAAVIPSGAQTFQLFRQGPNTEWDFIGKAVEFILYDAPTPGRTTIAANINDYFKFYN
jgi:hypothetical protein